MIFLKKEISEDLNFQKFNVESMEEDPLSTEQIKTILSLCVGLLVPSIDGDTLNVVLKVCLRLIREYENCVPSIDGDTLNVVLRSIVTV